MTDALRGSVVAHEATFFISRAGADAELAIWVGTLIARQGKSYILQDEHFGHEDFMVAMHKALSSGARVVALYSQAYLDSKYCVREATEALKGDPANELQRLIPLRIEPCAPAGMLNVTRTDLIAERRQADASALALRILRALGFENPNLDNVPPPPEGVLAPPAPIIHPEIRVARTDLAPREELMARLAAVMKGSGGRVAALTDAQRVVGLAGMGGVGKTVLAREYARRHAAEYQGVWWIDAEQKGTMLSGLAGLGAELSERIKAETNVELAARATLRLIEEAGYARPFLLVYDNVEKPGDIELWTPRAGAHVLITTRFTDWDPMVGTVDVGMLDREAAIDFLCRRTGRPDEREEAGMLADELGCLPLALDHAAAYCSAAPYSSFRVYRERLAKRLDFKPSAGSQPGLYRYSVRETFSIALERVIAGDAAAGVKACPEVEIVMGVAALLAPVPIPVSLFSGPRFADADLDAAFRALGQMSLASFGKDARGETTLTVHRLVQAVMGERVEEAGMKADLSETALTLLTDAMPRHSEDYTNWAACGTLAPHALELLEAAAPADGKGGRRPALLAFNTAKYLQRVARYSEAEALLQRVLAIDEKTVGAEHPQAATLRELASLYQAQGRYGEAEPLLERSLAISEKTVGAEHSDTSATLHGLAILYQAQGRYGEAEPLLKRSLAIDEKTVGAEHPQAATLRELASLYQAQGRYGEAEPLLQRSLAIYEKAVGAWHPDTSTTLHELARLYQAQGRNGEAEPLLRRSLAIDEKTVGAEHPSASISLRQWAILTLDTGRVGAAEATIGRALAVQRRIWGGDHPRLGQTYDPMALIALAKGDLPQAERIARDALSLRQAKLAAGHPGIAQSRWTLARVLIAKGEAAEAEPLLKEAIAALEAKVTAEHVWLKGARQTLAELRGAPAQSSQPAQPSRAAAKVGLLSRFFRARPVRTRVQSNR